MAVKKPRLLAQNARRAGHPFWCGLALTVDRGYLYVALVRER
jgi:hypothetical protein